jgi:hypothetical protein
MKQNVKNSGKTVNMLLGRLAAEKKKSITALCLITVMVFMWVRMLGAKAPANAEGASSVAARGANGEDKSNSELKISFIELSKVKGRNDVLTRDFFAADRWQSFIGEGAKLRATEEGTEEFFKEVAKKLNLEAISLGGNPQAFINDKMLSIGDKLMISDGVNTYECEVVGIEEKTVFIRCGEAEITLKLTQVME